MAGAVLRGAARARDPVLDHRGGAAAPELTRTRERGYALTQEEMTLGNISVAVALPPVVGLPPIALGLVVTLGVWMSGGSPPSCSRPRANCSRISARAEPRTRLPEWESPPGSRPPGGTLGVPQDHVEGDPAWLDAPTPAAAPETLLAAPDQASQAEITAEIEALHAEAGASCRRRGIPAAHDHGLPPYRSSLLLPHEESASRQPETIELWSPAYGQRATWPPSNPTSPCSTPENRSGNESP